MLAERPRPEGVTFALVGGGYYRTKISSRNMNPLRGNLLTAPSIVKTNARR